MNKNYPVRFKELTEKEAQELRKIGFYLERLTKNLYFITFKEAVK